MKHNLFFHFCSPIKIFLHFFFVYLFTLCLEKMFFLEIIMYYLYMIGFQRMVKQSLRFGGRCELY